MSDAEKALEEIAVVEEKTQNDKKKVDSAKAVEMRNRALKNLDGTQKGQRKQEVENETAPRAKTRRSGGDTVAQLREKNDLMHNRRLRVRRRSNIRNLCRSCYSELNSNKNRCKVFS